MRTLAAVAAALLLSTQLVVVSLFVLPAGDVKTLWVFKPAALALGTAMALYALTRRVASSAAASAAIAAIAHIADATAPAAYAGLAVAAASAATKRRTLAAAAAALALALALAPTRVAAIFFPLAAVAAVATIYLTTQTTKRQTT